jgi:hypothetical protein
LRKAVQVALKEDEKGNLEPETIDTVGKAVDDLRHAFEKQVPQERPDYITTRNTLKAMAGLTKMLYSSKIEKILAELEDYQGTTMGDLLGFMQAFNLRFGPANSYRQRQIYVKLYPMLAEQVNGTLGTSIGAVQAAASQASNAAESLGNKAVAAAESLGSGVVSGLRAAATDLFKDMGWEHLSGSGSTPAQP